MSGRAGDSYTLFLPFKPKYIVIIIIIKTVFVNDYPHFISQISCLRKDKQTRNANKKKEYLKKIKENMKKKSDYLKVAYWVFLCVFILTGCQNNYNVEENIFIENEREELEDEKIGEPKAELDSVPIEADSEDPTEDIPIKPEVVDADWSEYFHGINGTAVIYDVAHRRYTMYNSDLALTRRSPCSTFKIISSLIALENGILEPEDSTRTWSGEIFWNEDWNRDIDFTEAFRASCVWYYRQVIDDIGKDMMKKELNKLHYGNCDISDWDGQLNTNNNHRALTGFWIESSLMISPKEQVEVLERIFGENSDYSKETQNELKQVMLVSGQNKADILIYGKTGMGKAEGVVVDAWFTGFAEGAKGNIYFCVHLGKTDGKNISGSSAREIAIEIVSDFLSR